MGAASGEASLGRRPRFRRVIGAVALVAGLAVAADGGLASGEATPEIWEPPVGKVYAGPPGDGPRPEDPQLEVGDLVARGTRGPDGECIDPPGGVGVGFTPPDGHEMHVSVGLQDGTCDWVIRAIEISPSTGEEAREPCDPGQNTETSGCGVGGPAEGLPQTSTPTQMDVQP